MAAMAIGGILLSLLAPRLSLWPSPALRLRIGLVASGAAAFLALLPLGFAASIAVSFLIGAGSACSPSRSSPTCANGPAIAIRSCSSASAPASGYFICNLPALLHRLRRSAVRNGAALLCLAGIGVTLAPTSMPSRGARSSATARIPFSRVLACFTALVWLDSAAFFIIQNNPALKAGTWQGSAPSVGQRRAASCCGAGQRMVSSPPQDSLWFSRCRSLRSAIACLLLLDPSRVALASIFYPIGVSLYSVALVAYPSLLAPAASAAERGRRPDGSTPSPAGPAPQWASAWARISATFRRSLSPPPVQSSSAIAAIALLRAAHARSCPHRSSSLLAAFSRIAASSVPGRTRRNSRRSSAAARSTSPRAASTATRNMSARTRPTCSCGARSKPSPELRLQHPPLIGNRRQGPDLSQVGGRRSPLWLKAHFYNPAEVSGASIMPSFAFLFRDRRGDDLVAYLESLHGAGTSRAHRDEENLAALRRMPCADADAGTRRAALSRRYCATCHSADGHTRMPGSPASSASRPTSRSGPFFHLPPSDHRTAQRFALRRSSNSAFPEPICPDMNICPTTEIASIALWLSQQIAQPNQNP